MREQRARLRRLSIWFCINLIIFVACYLNYRLQLKHRYLYRTLSVGLCFSRAAAMIINFNLLLVWLPMCKYSLTRLAFHANNLLSRLKREQQGRQKTKNLNNGLSSSLAPSLSPVVIDLSMTKQLNLNLYHQYKTKQTKSSCFMRKFKQSLADASNQLKGWLCQAKLNFINSFLIAVDHCTPLHTICATTITIASVIHTVAHLMNVINFSKNFDPLLGNLNMAEYKGQNPFQLLLSVPGITGCLMVIILILMSLSSTDMIRNSSYDLFQIFHRLSIIFVFLLFLHPYSHVLKEQSNVDRHHPELCNVSEMTSPLAAMNFSALQQDQRQVAAFSEPQENSTIRWPRQTLSGLQVTQSLSSVPPIALTSSSSGSLRNRTSSTHQGLPSKLSATSPPSSRTTSATHQHYYDNFVNNNNKTDLNHQDTIVEVRRSTWPLQQLASNTSELLARPFNSNEQATSDKIFCLDPKPLFVAQSSICWYVLSIGLSCYLFDLILRKWRRSKSSIRLLDVRSDCEGNLIELILSNNHKRFSQWLPGQFIYLNCPQLAAYEWHPFTISSMDNKSRQFTLHIKTGGDWTRKLREKLENRRQAVCLRENSMSSMNTTSCYCVETPDKFERNQNLSAQTRKLTTTTTTTTSCLPSWTNSSDERTTLATTFESGSLKLVSPVHIGTILPNLDCYNRVGKLQVECTKVVQISSDQLDNANHYDYRVSKGEKFGRDVQLDGQLRSVVVCDQTRRECDKLNLYIDGPFHSPFERLLEQQVSVCIANGVGWTAFSSTFQCITNNYSHLAGRDAAMAGQVSSDWWWKWRNFTISKPAESEQRQTKMLRKLSDTKLHIMVIVTSIEQLRPFYELARNYFNRIQDECQLSGAADPLNPVREITAFITRSTKEDGDVRSFCEQEKLFLFNSNDNQMIRVNEVFTIEFGKPQFDHFLSSFNVVYPDSKKVSVYCCGSYQVKKTVKDICQHLNKANKSCDARRWPVYSYHEENF